VKIKVLAILPAVTDVGVTVAVPDPSGALVSVLGTLDKPDIFGTSSEVLMAKKYVVFGFKPMTVKV
jgi:hypothetical protein